MINPDPDSFSWLRFAFASTTVIALMTGMAFALRYFSMRGWIKSSPVNKRIEIVTTYPLDARRRLVLVKHDQMEHLILLGPTGDTHITSTPLAPSADKATPND